MKKLSTVAKKAELAVVASEDDNCRFSPKLPEVLIENPLPVES